MLSVSTYFPAEDEPKQFILPNSSATLCSSPEWRQNQNDPSPPSRFKRDSSFDLYGEDETEPSVDPPLEKLKAEIDDLETIIDPADAFAESKSELNCSPENNKMKRPLSGMPCTCCSGFFHIGTKKTQDAVPQVKMRSFQSVQREVSREHLPMVHAVQKSVT